MTPKAAEDLESIFHYISSELFAISSANNIIMEIEKGIIGLREFPFSCSYVADEYLRLKGYRKLIVDNYIVFYLIEEELDQVIVMRILYGKQKYEDLL